jgi:hypothetical protein
MPLGSENTTGSIGFLLKASQRAAEKVFGGFQSSSWICPIALASSDHGISNKAAGNRSECRAAKALRAAHLHLLMPTEPQGEGGIS